MDVGPSYQHISSSHNLLPVPDSVTTTVDFTVLPLIPAGEVRPMPVVILIQRFHPGCQKAITGKKWQESAAPGYPQF